MSVAHVDIENAKTKIVDTLDLNIIENDGKDLKFDISLLNEEELNKLKYAIDTEIFYTDIELFYIDDSSTPYFGTDYNFKIQDNVLIVVLKDKMRKYIDRNN